MPTHTPVTDTLALADFLNATRIELCERASGLLTPRYTADLHRPAAEQLARLHGRPFLSAQIDIAAALALSLRTHRIAFCIGEQGVGKSQIALGAAVLAQAQRILIVAPPHLIENWIRHEIAPVWPQAHLTTLTTLADLRTLPTLPTPLIALLSRETAKLGPIFTPALIRRRLRSRSAPNAPPPMVWACPHCARPLLTSREQYLVHPTDAPAFCPHQQCGASLWTVKHPAIHGHPAPRRTPLARHLLRTMPRWFDLLILDELHEYQGHDTLQGEAMGHLVQACRATLGLTGTLFNGYASSLFPILWRTDPRIRHSFPHHAHSKWVTHYGLWDKQTRSVCPPAATSSNGPPKPKLKHEIRERPGISPAILLPLMDRTAFVRMKDLYQHLPPYAEHVLSIEMTTAQRQAYGALHATLSSAIQSAIARKAWKRIGLYMTTLMTWPDRCWVSEPLEHHDTFNTDRLPLPPVLPTGQTYPKEKLLLELIQREKAAGRKVLVYCTHTGARDLTARLDQLCKQAGLRTDILTATIPPQKRLDWIEAHTPTLDALICQPRLIATGLTLNDYPTIVFMEPVYSISTLRQASRRSWRLNQTKPVTVYFMSYLHTAQEQAWGLIARKLKASLLIEGDLDQTGEGLATFNHEGDFLVELAKQIVQTGSEAEQPDSLQALFQQCRAIEGLPTEDAHPSPSTRTPSLTSDPSFHSDEATLHARPTTRVRVARSQRHCLSYEQLALFPAP